MSGSTKKKFVVRWPDVWAMLGICAAVVLVITALFFGYSL